MFEDYLTKTGRLSVKQPQELKNQWYTQQCNQVHGYIYDYSLFVYTTRSSKVKIICKTHGVFLQRVSDHLQGKGCPKCQDTRKTQEQCITDFKKVHGDLYEYSKVVYINNATNVSILCKLHGYFEQTPNTHLQGKGCPKCQNHNQDILYVLRCRNTGLIKIGITNNLEKRIQALGGNLEYLKHKIMDNPRDLEKILHKRYQSSCVFNKTVRSGGTEFFQISKHELDKLLGEL